MPNQKEPRLLMRTESREQHQTNQTNQISDVVSNIPGDCINIWSTLLSCIIRLLPISFIPAGTFFDRKALTEDISYKINFSCFMMFEVREVS